MNATRLISLIDSLAGRLTLYARQWTDTPEDVVQEAFVKLVRLSREPDEPRAWLFRVVRHAALDAGKASRRRERRERSAARPESWFVEPAIDGLDAVRAVTALESLPPEQREIIVARLWGGLSFEEIASIAGCSPSSAHRRFSAGIDTLRRTLRESCEPTRSNS